MPPPSERFKKHHSRRHQRRRHHKHHHPFAFGDYRPPARIALVGNANVGKSVIFGHLTGKYASVSNYPGTTVEVTRGISQISGRRYEIVDTPGIKSLLATSEDEAVARQIIFDEKTTQIIQIADSKNLRRTLHLAFQLAEIGLPQVLVLNMMDEAEKTGIKIDAEKLSLLLGIPVIPTIAIKGKGILTLREKIQEARNPAIKIRYPPQIEKALESISQMIDGFSPKPRVIASLILMGDPVSSLLPGLPSQIEDRIDQLVVGVTQNYSDPLSVIMMMSHSDEAQRIMDQVMTFEDKKRAFAEFLSELTIHPISGSLIFAAILIIVFGFVGFFGAGFLVDLIETQLFDDLFNKWATDVVNDYIPFDPLRDILVGDYGVITVGLTMALAIVLPIVATFFLAFALLEDSGYLPRLALMGNRLLNMVGLNGKAVLPLVLGTGCGTMATMATRVLETRRERIIATLMLALGIPCSAQLGVILGLMTFVSPLGVIIVFGVVLSQLLLVAYLANLILPGESSDFILEIPPLRIPNASNVLMKTWIRIEWFLIEAVPIFLIGTFIVSIANLLVLGEQTLLEHVITASEPIVSGLLGLPEDASVALLLGFLRRDYGAAGLFDMARSGELSNVQMVVGSVVLALFVPCVAALFMIAKEYGTKVAVGMLTFIIPFSIAVGSILRFLLTISGAPV